MLRSQLRWRWDDLGIDQGNRIDEIDSATIEGALPFSGNPFGVASVIRPEEIEDIAA